MTKFFRFPTKICENILLDILKGVCEGGYLTFLKVYVKADSRDGFREHGSLDHLSFWGPTQVWPIWPFVWKAWKYAPLVCSALSKSIFCGVDFRSTIALDLQQKLKPFPHSSKEQMALGSFLGIYSSFV